MRTKHSHPSFILPPEITFKENKMKTIDLNRVKHMNEMRVVYQDEASIARQYTDAIRTLDLSEGETACYLELDRLATFRPALEHRLEKTKLWNYAPDQREDVKTARSFLTLFLAVDIPYGQTVYVPREETEGFLEDEACMLGVAEYHPAHKTLPQMGEALEQRIESLVAEPVHKVQHLAESVIDKIPNPLHLASA
jgi:hypothetical protein